MNKTLTLAVAALVVLAGAARAEAVTYTIDPTHSYPSFEADHMGMSNWRGKFDKTSGTIRIDRAAGTGTVDVVIDATSIDYGLAAMNKAAKSSELFDTAKYPKARFTGTLQDFADGAPKHVVGTLDLHGVKKPVTLEIHKFKCMPHPMLKRDWCGADASTTINREDFGMAAGKDYGFDMKVDLRIQVEALAAK